MKFCGYCLVGFLIPTLDSRVFLAMVPLKNCFQADVLSCGIDLEVPFCGERCASAAPRRLADRFMALNGS